MLAALEVGANPSSVHAAGRAARKVLETAREQVGGAIGSRAQDIVFTSGGTEASALALHGLVAGFQQNCTLLVSAVEHEAVVKNAGTSGVAVETAYVDRDGELDLAQLAERLGNWDKDVSGIPILAIMLANNETGVLQPVRDAAALVREAGGIVHCDAVQGLGKVPVNVAMLGVDTLALSAHKCGGPQGVGALWIRAGAPVKPILVGGGQERSVRSGTENLSGIAGFGAAAKAAVAELDAFAELASLRDLMETRLKAEGAVIMGEQAPRLANTSCFARKGFRSETQVMAMDLAGVCVSSGSACSSGKVKRSLVLGAMGVDEALLDSAIRVSFGWNSRPEDFEALVEAWIAAAGRIPQPVQ